MTPLVEALVATNKLIGDLSEDDTLDLTYSEGQLRSVLDDFGKPARLAMIRMALTELLQADCN